MAKNPSASSQILDYLKTLDPEAEFTSLMLQEQLGVTGGAVSGYLAKLKTDGHVRVVGTANRSMVYRVVDLSGASARQIAGRGSVVGRTHAGTSSAEKAANLLRAVADEIEGYKSSLDSYSTEELLREIMKRQKREARS